MSALASTPNVTLSPGTRRAETRLHPRVEAWFASQSWSPFDFQFEAREAYLRGASGLIHAPTGMGKTIAAWLGPVEEYLAEHPDPPARGSEPIRLLWITPMRALATDTTRSLTEAMGELALPWRVEKRTGDTSSGRKARQRERLPTVLVTTPESLSVLLSYPSAHDTFASLRCVVVDEWHELLSTKRGTQTELCLARLRASRPDLRTWGLSATLGNLDEAAEALIGIGASPPKIIRGIADKRIDVRTIIPDDLERFPWAGHLGLRLLAPVLQQIERARTSLIFTNTRMQSELWFRAIIDARPDWLGRIAIHHGSLDREVRNKVEQHIRDGRLLGVVCTSSLDLGVDFSPVDQVIQIGSPKGIGRLIQRAGRSGHQPGAASSVVFVPTSALELVEIAAAREAIAARHIESRRPLDRPLDVLVQHLVTVAIGGGFEPDAMFDEVRSTRAFRDLQPEEWRWCLDFILHGGGALGAYPRFRRAEAGESGRLIGARAVERLHRLGIGTITSEASVTVRYASGGVIGTIEEGFIARLRAGDKFVLGGRPLELVRVRDMTAVVKRARTLRGAIPRWDGGRSPLSTELSHATRRMLSDPGARSEEMDAIRPLLDWQAQCSRLPSTSELLIEHIETREGFHVFVYPFEGRLVHEGLGALASHRLARQRPRTMTVSMNDYGFEIVSDQPLPTDEASWRVALSAEELLEDLLSCLNSTELTRRHFRDIARIAGLLIPGFPGAPRSARHAQASSGLFFDVFTEFDPGNRLLDQARREVLDQQLEIERLRFALLRVREQRIVISALKSLSPMSFPLWAESLRTQRVSSESWSDRVRKMAVLLEAEASGTPVKPVRRVLASRSRGAARHAR